MTKSATWKTNLSSLSPQILYCTIVISNYISSRYNVSKFVYATSSTESNKSSFLSGISSSSPWNTLRHVFGTKNTANLSTTKSRSFLDSELDFLQCVVSEEDDHHPAPDDNNASSSGMVHQPQMHQQQQQQEIMVSLVEDSSTSNEDQQQQQDQEYHLMNSIIEQNSSNESPITKERKRRNAAFGLQEEEDVEETNESLGQPENDRGMEQQEREEEVEESLQYDYYYEYDDSDESLEEAEVDDDDWYRLPQKVPFRQDDEEDLSNQSMKTATNTMTYTEEDSATSVTADSHTAKLVSITNDAQPNNTSIFENDAKTNKNVYTLQSSTLSLRQLRKTASRMTGMTGFFSGKQKQNILKASVTTLHNKDGNNSTVEEHLGDDELGVIRRRIAAIKKARDAVVNREEEEMRRRSTTTTPTTTSTGNAAGNPAMGPLRWLAAKRRALSLNSKSLDLQQQQQFSRGQKNDVTRSGTKNQQLSPLLSEEEGIDLFREYPAVLDAVASAEAEAQKARTIAAQAEEERRKGRVSEINRQIDMAKDYLFELQSEKDDLLRRPNPFFNFTTVTAAGAISTKTKRYFNFPSQGLVDEYIEHLVSSGRLNILNHTFLWKEAVATELDEEEDNIRIEDDDLFSSTPYSDARRARMLYRTGASVYSQRRNPTGMSDSRVTPASSQSRNGLNANNNGGGGSWLLRQSIGKGESLGEKIGQVIETSTYKAVCKNVMSLLARSISSLHGLSILNHSSVRLYIESAPDLPPVGDLLFHGGDTYAAETLKRAIRRSTAAAASSTDSGGSPSIRKRKKGSRRHHGSKSFMDDNSAFLQHDAVVETLLSNCQISAPLLKLFPLPWQRALLANVVTLVLAVVNDFVSGIRIQILGHTLSLTLEPITEFDLLDLMERNSFTRALDSSRRAAEFEEAVIATASDLSEQLLFLDKWHERALGSGMLRAQIANLIARVVLTVSEDILTGTEINLWTKQASGPRVIADLEYRVI